MRRGLALLPNPPREQVRSSAKLADEVARSLRAEGFEAETGRGAYYVLKGPEAPSLLIEMGFLSNPQEAALLGDPAYQERLASAIARGLMKRPASRGDPPAVQVVRR